MHLQILLLILGLVSLIIGSRLVVDNAVKIAQVFGASGKFIGVTIVSVGTSLPELVTSVVVAPAKNRYYHRQHHWLKHIQYNCVCFLSLKIIGFFFNGRATNL